MLSENDLKSMRIGVAGMGVTGKAVVSYLIKKSVKELIIVDKEPKQLKEEYSEQSHVQVFSQADPLCNEELERCDLVIISPGISREVSIFEKYLAKGGQLIGEIEFAFQIYHTHKGFDKTKLVAITGTNGKTTSVSFLQEAFANEGLNAFVGGNIGVPFVKALDNEEYFDIILLELSSFQLESIEEFHANIAVLLNIFPNHGERYLSFKDYFLAKWNITKNMNFGDLCLFPKGENLLVEKLDHLQCEYKLLEVRDAEKVRSQIEQKYSLKKFKLLGDHNIYNLNYCVHICEHLNISTEALQQTIDSFKGVEHRVEVCESRFPFLVINDAKSTNLDASMSAIRSVPTEKDLYLILGGKVRGKGEDLNQYLPEIKSRVHKVFLIGEAAQQLSQDLESNQVAYELCGDLLNVIYKAKELDKESALLFSPGFPSFDQFKNYAERGKAFKKLVL